MKIGLTGPTGLFGQGLLRVLGEQHEVLSLPHAHLDLIDKKAVFESLQGAGLELLVHPAGIPDIDLCEIHPDQCWQTNVEATRNLCQAAEQFGFGLAFISTDAVFDGEKNRPYVETDEVNPPTVYGRSKVAAEELVKRLAEHWIFRVSVLFGPGKTNFVERGIKKLRQGEEYVVASDQMGSATYTIDAARTILQICQTGRSGIYHLSNAGACTRYELACEAARLAGLDSTGIKGKPMSSMQRPAVRLKYSVMEMAALNQAGVPTPRPWHAALKEYVENLKL
jgi:dTDP-4-dehydrorhamnose reductase